MNKDLDYYMSLPYRVEVIPDEEEGGFALHCLDLNGCMTCAETLEDGFKMRTPSGAGLPPALRTASPSPSPHARRTTAASSSCGSRNLSTDCWPRNPVRKACP